LVFDVLNTFRSHNANGVCDLLLQSDVLIQDHVIEFMLTLLYVILERVAKRVKEGWKVRDLFSLIA